MIVKGFVLDDERLKQGQYLGKDYFDDLWCLIWDLLHGKMHRKEGLKS